MTTPKQDNLISQRRLGNFRIAEYLVCTDLEPVLQALAGCFVIRCELRYDTISFHYTAYHPDFEPVSPGIDPPSYEAVMERGEESGVIKFVGFKKLP